MSGHRPFNELLAKLPADRRERIERETGEALAELERPSIGSKFLVYRDRIGQFRWRLIAATGEVLAESATGFSDHTSCIDSINLLRVASSTLDIELAA
jgi:uncharacterized protein YegP (UPF0339 family)